MNEGSMSGYLTAEYVFKFEVLAVGGGGEYSAMHVCST